jgi:hypothetical protein
MKKNVFSIFLVLFITTFTFGQKKDEFKPEVKIGGVIYTGWEFNVDNANFISKLDTSSSGVNESSAFGYNPTKNQFETSMNSFYIERAYINVLASLAPNVKGRITPDVFSFKDQGGTTQYMLGLKYAWVDWTAYKHESGTAVDFTLGIIPNRWIANIEKYWGYRGFAKTLTDYSYTTAAPKSGNTISRTTGSYFSSADMGFEGSLMLPKGYGEIYTNVFNGNGYRNLNFDNRFKDFMGSLFIHPLAARINKKMDAAKSKGKDRINGIADLTLGGFVYVGKLANGEDYTIDPANGIVGAQYVRNRFGGMVSFKYNLKKFGFIKVGGEFSAQSNKDPYSSSKPDSLLKTNSTGLSAWLEFNPPVEQLNEKLMLVARFDMFDPNTANDNTSTTSFNNNTDKQSLLILGLAYKPTKVCTLGITYQATTYQSQYIVKYDGSTTKTDARLLVHGILEF